MCGIVGFIDPQRVFANTGRVVLSRMLDQMISRGPDSKGVELFSQFGLGLGHRRLSILDLSDAGHQPMKSHSGRYTLVFNGELYNFQDLKNELNTTFEGIRWQGSSDTEVLLTAIDQFGLVPALSKSNGMFALALYDSKSRTLTLARDRVGEKPLYYGTSNGVFIFSSQLSAFHSVPGFRGSIDKDALVSYFRHNYVPAPLSIYENVSKLNPGCIIEVKLDEHSFKTVESKEYWRLESFFIESECDSIDASFERTLLDLETRLFNAVSLRMSSDVPLGALLSGGIDSSLIVAMMQRQSASKVNTFTVGFNESEFNEAVRARKIANYLETEHTEIYVDQKQALETIPRIPLAFDEPFSDSSQIPTMLVYALAKKRITVCLSGDGGDELFAGYTRYLDAQSLYKRMRIVPQVFRWPLHFTLKRLSTLFSGLGVFMKKMERLSEMFEGDSRHSSYRRYLTHWTYPEVVVRGGNESFCAFESLRKLPMDFDFVTFMRLCDLKNYLPDDILVKLDRASMYSSIEGRLPFLGPEVIQFSANLSTKLLIHEGTGKHLLKSLAYRWIPQNLLNSPKMGFGIPLASWLRNELREWAEDLLSKRSLEESGLLNSELVCSYWEQHKQGLADWHFLLWDVLMFQTWYRTYHLKVLA